MKTNPRGRVAAAMGWLALLAAPFAEAQISNTPPPDIQQQGQQQERRQQEREDAQRGRLQSAPDLLQPAAQGEQRPWPLHEASCQPIRAVVLAGEASESFRWVLDGLVAGSDPAVGRCLGAEGINVTAGRAQAALLARGYVTSRILLQPQNLADGTLTLSLVPGRVPQTHRVGIQSMAVDR